MDILGIVLLRVYSRTLLPIFIKIGLYLTDKEQKISWHRFLRHGVVSGNMKGLQIFTGVPLGGGVK